MIRKSDAEDHRHLVFLSEVKDVKKIAQSPKAIKILWEVAQVPEFNKNLTNDHVYLLSKIYEQLILNGQLKNDFISSQIYSLDKVTKDIDTLMQRIASIRTWTYLSHKNDWLANSNNWQDISLAIEDKLSDALNSELTNRFVDKRISVLGKKIKENLKLVIEIKSDSSIYLDSMKVGELNGFVLKLVDSSAPSSGLFLKNLKKSLDAEIKKRVKNFYTIEDQHLEINDEAKIFWGASPIGWLTPSDDPFSPNIHIVQSDLLEDSQINLITERLKNFVYNKIEKFLFPLISLNEEEFNSSARGIIFQLKEGFGTTPFKKIQKLYKELSDEDKKALSKAGLRFGVEYLYIPELLKPAAVRLRALLWGVFNNTYYNNSLPDDGRVAFSPKESAPQQWYNLIGYSKLGDRVMRVDMVERLSVIIRASARDGSFKISEDMLSIAGASKDQMANILSDLGFEKSKESDDVEVTFETLFKKKSNSYSKISKLKSKKNPIKRKQKKVAEKQKFNQKNKTLINPNSPFSVLSSLKLKN